MDIRQQIWFENAGGNQGFNNIPGWARAEHMERIVSINELQNDSLAPRSKKGLLKRIFGRI